MKLTVFIVEFYVKVYLYTLHTICDGTERTYEVIVNQYN